MDSVSAVNATTAPVQPGAVSSVGDLDYHAFLRLLIAQLKNQDPTKPMDSTQFVAQLATFSQVEQSIAANAKLDSLITASALSLADAVIGHTITSADGSAHGTVASVAIVSEGPIATLTDGRTVALGAGIVIE